jgi:hypothetical protein
MQNDISFFFSNLTFLLRDVISEAYDLGCPRGKKTLRVATPETAVRSFQGWLPAEL